MSASPNHTKNIFETLGRHPIHPFPARMAPGIALDALGRKKRLRVLDPMMGSGTVLAVARAKGHRTIGTDLDPLAVLIARVWTSRIDPEKTVTKAREVLLRAKMLSRNMRQADAYPKGCDKETKRFIRYWFDAYVRRQLTALSNVISRVQDSRMRDVLWCSFSRLIITKNTGASLAMDLAHSRPHREYLYAPVKPFNQFIQAVETVTTNCLPRGAISGPATKVTCGDARSLAIKDNSIDLVLTSPPYLNAIDYMRCSKFSLVWMGHSVSAIRELRRESVGAEMACEEASTSPEVSAVLRNLKLSPQLPDRNKGILSHYIWDMNGAVAETARVLRPGGKAIYVVGDSTVRGTFISNSTIVTVIAKCHGLKLLRRRSRILPENRRYLPPPRRTGGSASMNARMRREVILVFKKSSKSKPGSHRLRDRVAKNVRSGNRRWP